MKKPIRNALDQIKAKSPDKRLHWQDVVKEARKPSSPLHACFTWDKAKGFEKNLMREAQDLAREYLVVVELRHGKVEKVRHLVSLSSDRSTGGGYRTLHEVLSNADMTRQLLEDAMNELRVFRTKYARLSELASVFAAIDAAEAKQRARSTTKRARKAA